jgi:hypothetical protein
MTVGDVRVVGLEVHHQEFRSQGGDDSDTNLITLCVACHQLLHCGSAEARR